MFVNLKPINKRGSFIAIILRETTNICTIESTVNPYIFAMKVYKVLLLLMQSHIEIGIRIERSRYYYNIDNLNNLKSFRNKNEFLYSFRYLHHH